MHSEKVTVNWNGSNTFEIWTTFFETEFKC